MTHELETYGLILLFAFVAVECIGIPLPGEAALLTASVLAGTGHFNIVEVIAVAAAAAIVGDSTGYWIARVGGRPALGRIPWARHHLPKLLPRAEAFFDRHGPKTVVIGRFFAGLRITVAWLAGISHMPWGRFLLYNGAGGILWAASTALAAYYFGRAAVDAVTKYGLYAALGIIAVGVIGFFGHRLLKGRTRKGIAPESINSLLESEPAE